MGCHPLIGIQDPSSADGGSCSESTHYRVNGDVATREPAPTQSRREGPPPNNLQIPYRRQNRSVCRIVRNYDKVRNMIKLKIKVRSWDATK